MKRRDLLEAMLVLPIGMVAGEGGAVGGTAPVDYRVDSAKLVWRPPAYPGEPHRPPVQCLARMKRPLLQGMSIGDWLLWSFFRLFESPRDRADEERALRYAEQCNGFDGHWAYDGQHEHVNGYGQRWPVTAADTARLNP